MSRKALLLLLQERCRELGIAMEFQREIRSLDELPEADLVIACNGINSWVREAYADHFRPSYDWRPNKFVWLGSTRPLPAFTFDFRENDAGIWNLHAYQYDAGMSTWIVETTAETFARAGLEDEDETGTVAYVRRSTRICSTATRSSPTARSGATSRPSAARPGCATIW